MNAQDATRRYIQQKGAKYTAGAFGAKPRKERICKGNNRQRKNN